MYRDIHITVGFFEGDTTIVEGEVNLVGGEHNATRLIPAYPTDLSTADKFIQLWYINKDSLESRTVMPVPVAGFLLDQGYLYGDTLRIQFLARVGDQTFADDKILSIKILEGIRALDAIPPKTGKVGDMLKEDYDADGDLKVDKANFADTANEANNYTSDGTIAQHVNTMATTGVHGLKIDSNRYILNGITGDKLKAGVADLAHDIDDNTITTVKIQDGAVNDNKLGTITPNATPPVCTSGGKLKDLLGYVLKIIRELKGTSSWDSSVRHDINHIIPVGFIGVIPFWYDVDDWMICDGRTLLISAYPELYARIGTRYGGDGQSNFKLPETRGRTVFGFDGNPWFPYMGRTGGDTDFVISLDQMPYHGHTCSANGAHSHGASGGGSHCHSMTHSHNVSYSTTEYSVTVGVGDLIRDLGHYNGDFDNNNSGSVDTYYGNTGYADTPAPTIYGVGDHGHNIGWTGGGQSHSNMPPFITMCWAILTK